MARLTRKRFTFYPHDRVAAILEPLEHGKLGRYINDAVWEFANPTFRFIVPTSDEQASPEPLIKNTEHELIFVGVNLWSLAYEWKDLLRGKVESGVTMTFITIHPDIGPCEPAFETLRRQLGSECKLNEKSIANLSTKVINLASIYTFSC